MRCTPSSAYLPDTIDAKKLHAIIWVNYGWINLLWFPSASDAKEIMTLQEKMMEAFWQRMQFLRNKVFIDISKFAKYLIRVDKPCEWLKAVSAKKMPTDVRRTYLSLLISMRGTLYGDFNVSLVTENEYWIYSLFMAERFKNCYFMQRLCSQRSPLKAL